MAIRMMLMFAAVGCAVAGAADVRFIDAPTVRTVGDSVEVSFAVSGPTDVEVAVLDKGGRVIRHLAAGVLGGANPRPAPLVRGLAQKLTWDGKDDKGDLVRSSDQAGGGPFSVRVRAGMGAKFGRLIGGSPYTFGNISSIACDEAGNVYVMTNGGVLNQRQVSLRVFDPEGRYLREILPFPADLAPDAAKGVANWDAERGVFRPINHQNLNPLFYPAGQDMRLVSASETSGVVITSGTRVCRLGLDGGGWSGPTPMWSAAAKLRNPAWNIPQLAVSPDGRYVYYSNVAGTPYDANLPPSSHDPNWPQGRVYRQDTRAAGADPVKFHDLELPDYDQQKYWMPDAWNKRTAAYGVATDPKGHVYICDLVNQAIVETDPDGRKRSVTAVPWPELVRVNGQTGDYYVICRLDSPANTRAARRLVKVSGRGDAAKVVAELPLRSPLGETIALGLRDGKPVLWIAGGSSLLCLRDGDTEFETIQTAFAPPDDAQLDWNRLAVDYDRDVLYVNNGASLMWRYDGKTGQGGLLTLDGRPFHATDLAIGYDGLLYVRRGRGHALGSDYSGPFERYTPDLEPAPYPSGTHVLSGYIYSRYGIGYAERGIGVGPDGSAYISFMYDWVKYCTAGFGPDGRPLQGNYLTGQVGNKGNPKTGYPEDLTSAVVGPIPGGNGGIRVDRDGNIYIGMWVWPKDVPVPEQFARDTAYLTSTGSVIKFTRDGGFVTSPVKDWSSDPVGSTPRTDGAKGIEARSGYRTATLSYDAFIEGAVAAYPGYAPMSHANWGANSCCVCRVPRFDLDRYGRLVLPNAITNSVRILDNAGNLIVEFGAYGNFDSQFVNPATAAGQADRPTVAVPAIPLCWPTGAGFSASHVYVNDTYARRVIRADLTWQAEQTCPTE